MKNKNLDTVFVYDAEKNTHRACIVELVHGQKKPTFVKFIKPAKYHHTIPEFLRDEFTKKNGKLLRPVQIDGLPPVWYLKQKPEDKT